MQTTVEPDLHASRVAAAIDARGPHDVPKQIRENFEIRLELEPLAAALAAPRITSEKVARLEAIVRGLEACADRDSWSTLDRRLHLAVCEAAGRPLLLGMIEELHRSLDPNLRAVSAAPHSEAHEHREIVAALASGDADASREAMLAHLSNSLERLRSAIAKHSRSGRAA
jgi:GntR family transcriptional regulator, transcriptional repressor for pyruvate dehydrogenase complex